MVVVDVRDEHAVESAEILRRNLRHSPQVEHAAPEQRVGQDLRAVELDEDRRMPEPAQPVGHVNSGQPRSGTAHEALGQASSAAMAATRPVAIRSDGWTQMSARATPPASTILSLSGIAQRCSISATAAVPPGGMASSR